MAKTRYAAHVTTRCLWVSLGLTQPVSQAPASSQPFPWYPWNFLCRLFLHIHAWPLWGSLPTYIHTGAWLQGTTAYMCPWYLLGFFRLQGTAAYCHGTYLLGLFRLVLSTIGEMLRRTHRGGLGRLVEAWGMCGNASGRLGEAWGGLGKVPGAASGRRRTANWEFTKKNIGKCRQNYHLKQ